MTPNSDLLSDLSWKVKLTIYALDFAIGITRRSNGTVNRCIMSLFDFRSPPSKKPINGVTSQDITVDKARDLWFRLYTPTIIGEATFPVIFYFHGGGFVYLAPSSKPLDDFCYRLARELSAIVISVNYRLAPENRYPSQIEDCIDTIKFIDDGKLNEFSSYSNLKHCFLVGDSAGGSLIHQIHLKASKNVFSNIKLIGSMLIQPFFGGEERTESEIMLDGKVPMISMARTDWYWKAYLPEGSNRDHPAANVFGPNSDDISELKFPASLILVAGFDPLKDWQKRYYEDLKKSGQEVYMIEYPNTFHAYYVFPEISETSLLIKDMNNFMQKQLVAASAEDY